MMREKCRKYLALLLVFAMIVTYSFSADLLSVYADDEQGEVNAKAVATEETAPAVEDTKPAPEPKAEPEAEPKAEPKADPAPETPAPSEPSEPADNGSGDSGEAVQNDEAAGNAEESADPADAAPAKEPAPAAATADPKAAEEDADEEDADEEDAYPAVTLTKKVGGVTVTLKAPEGALPEGAKLSVKAVNSQAVFNAVENKMEAAGMEMVDAVAFDVTPLNKKGKEIQPKKAVQVTFSGTGLETGEGGSVEVYRVSDDASSVTAMGASGSANSQTFRTTHFTIYVSTGSASNPNGDGSGPNSASNPYVLPNGASITLRTNTTQSAHSNHWSVNNSGRDYVTTSYNNNNPKQLGVKNNNVVRQNNQAPVDRNVVITWSKGSTTENYYITVKRPHKVVFKLQDAGQTTFADYRTVYVNNGQDVPGNQRDPQPPHGNPYVLNGVTYDFAGWYTDEACTTKATNNSYRNITADKSFYAKYVPRPKAIFMFQDVDQSTFHTYRTVNANSNGNIPAGQRPQPPHGNTYTVNGVTYSFSGWCTDEACTVKAGDSDYTRLTGDKTFYGKYIPWPTVTFNFKDAGETEWQPTARQVQPGGNVTPPSYAATKEKDGKTYYWSEWCTNEECTTKATSGAYRNITESKTFFGKYTPEGTLTYHPNTNDAATVPDPVKGAAGTMVTTSKDATRDGYALESWNTEAGGGGTSYVPGSADDQVELLEEGVDLYAQWSSTTITITYHNNYAGAADVFDTEENVAGNSTVSVIASQPKTRTGDSVYFFKGWATSPTATSAQYYPEGNLKTGEEDIDLYALWALFTTEDLATQNLTIDPVTVTYDGTEQRIVAADAVNEVDNPVPSDESARPVAHYGWRRVGRIELGGELHHNIYADLRNIDAAGTDAGTYKTALTADLYEKEQGVDIYTPLGRVVPINDGEGGKLIIKPVEVKITTGTDDKIYDGTALTKKGKAEFVQGTGDTATEVTREFDYEGTSIELVHGEKLNIRTIGSQTEVGVCDNDYEIAWGTPQNWGSGFTASTAKQRNYNVDSDVSIGTLTVYYKVQFNKNCEDDVADMPVWIKATKAEGDANAKATLPDSYPTRDIYECTGWAKSANATEPDYTKGETIDITDDMLSGSTVTLYAFWTLKEYKITFVGNEGEVLQDKAFAYGSTPAYEGETPTKPEDEDYTYEFVGWDPIISEVTGEATYNAVFKKKTARITFDLDGGTLNGDPGPITKKYEIGSTITALDAPTKEGYDFVEWRGSSYQPGDEILVEEAHTLTAIWKDSSNPDDPDDPDDPDNPDDPADPDNPATPGGGGNGGAGTADAAVVADADDAAVTVEDNATPEAAAIVESPAPKSAPEDSWSVVDMLAAILTLIGAGLTVFRRNSSTVIKGIGIASGIAAIAIFVATQDLGGAMHAVDAWTPVLAGLVGVQVVTNAVTLKTPKVN